MKPLIKSEVAYKKNISEDFLVIGFHVDMPFEAGQFFQIIIDKDNSEDPVKGFRPYSILTSPNEYKSKNIIETYIRLVEGGLASSFIKKLEEGDEVLLRGPFGRFVMKKDATSHVFLSTGTGITPLYSIIREYVHNGQEMTLFYGAKTFKELAFHEEFLSLSKKYPNFTYYPTLTREKSDSWEGFRGRIQLHLGILGEKEQFKNKTFYICGLKEFVKDIREKLMLMGARQEDIIFERYD